MQIDNERLHVEFHDVASNIFFGLINEFETAVKTINRKSEEYKFQVVKDTYTHTLKQRLEDCAAQIMQEHSRNRKATELSQNLQEFIRQYLHQFVQKVSAM